METFAQLGVAGISLGIISWVVKYFIKAMETKDSYIQLIISENNKRNDVKDLAFEARYDKITNTYQTVTQEYIAEGITSRNRHIEVLQELTNCVRGCGYRK